MDIKFKSPLDSLVAKVSALDTVLRDHGFNKSRLEGLDLNSLTPACNDFIQPSKAKDCTINFGPDIDKAPSATWNPIPQSCPPESLTGKPGVNKLLYLFTATDFCLRIEAMKRALETMAEPLAEKKIFS